VAHGRRGIGGTGALAQAPGIKRTVVTRADVSVEGREAVVAKVELEAGAVAGRHSHPGDEISYILEGEGELLIDGEPPRRVKAGEAFVIPAGKVHVAKNTGLGIMRLVGTFVVEKGKPLATLQSKLAGAGSGVGFSLQCKQLTEERTMEQLGAPNLPALQRNEDYNQNAELVELAHSELDLVSGGPEIENEPHR